MFWSSIRERMSSLRLKIVVSLICMSILSVALAGLSSRLVLSDRFQNVVMVRSSEEFARDVVGWYRNHGLSLEQAYNSQSWEDHQAVLNQTRQQPLDSERLENAAHFIATDLEGRVWIPNGTFSVGDIATAEQLERAIPILDLDGTTSIGYIIVEGELILTGTEVQYLKDLFNSLWFSFFLVALIAVPVGISLGRRLTKPINNLSGAIQAMRPKTMHQTVPITSNDEIGLLSQSFNEMSKEIAEYLEVTQTQREQIEETESMRRQGLVNISHELRTPLYRLISQAYAMLDGIRPLDKEEMKKHAESLDHLSELLNDLHYLALSDVHAFSCDIESTDFSQIINKAIESRKEAFSTRQLSIHASVPDELVVDGDPTRLRQIIDNLLSNCVRYTNEGGEIYLQLKATEKHAELTISDNGPGVSPESLEMLFDRFYREESSRSRATGGSGLGLSLVKTCAEMHGGDASAFISEQGGLGICVHIPLHSSNIQSDV